MSECFEKARELGELILASEQSINLADATALFKADADAVKRMDEYKAYHNNIQESINNGALSQDEYRAALGNLKKSGTELKKNIFINDLINAENEFNGFVNQVISVLRSTITGDVEDGCGGGCSGGCCGCGKDELSN